jgi:tripartite-type tricarboxylate transporter receptor subunit TctC
MLSSRALAVGFPDRPIRLVVPYAPGGNADTTARLISPIMAKHLGQPVVVENRAGAGGSVGARQIAQAQPDGYTLLLGSNGPITVNPLVQANLGYEPLQDFAPIGLAVRTPQVVAVHRNFPPRTLAEFIARGREQPGRISVGSSGTASVSHLAIEMLSAATGAILQHVPYRGAGAMAPDLISGTINACITEISTALPLHRDGAIRILGIASTARQAVAPELPTIEEAGVADFHAAAFIGVMVPSGTPAEATDALAAALAAAVADPTTRKRLEEMGSEMASTTEATPAGFAAFLVTETAWSRAAAERAGLRPA